MSRPESSSMQAEPRLRSSIRGCGLLLGLAVALFLSVRAPAADQAPSFDAANQLYEQGRFPEAAAAYESILNAGTISPALYFNLGNAHLKAGQLGHAITAYRQATRLAPRDPDVRANLQFARGKVQAPTLIPSYWQRSLRRLTLNEWTFLATGVFWIWLFALTLIHLRSQSRGGFRAINYGGALMVVASVACLIAASRLESTVTAVIVTPSTSVHNGPFDESPTAFTAHDGAELQVLDRKDDWLQVTAGPRRIGWIRTRDAAILDRSIKGRTDREASIADGR